MTRASVLLVAVSIACSFSFVYGQQTRDAILVETMGELGCDDLQARLDLFADDVYTTPGAVGFAVIYPGENPFVNAAYERGIKFNSAFRGFPAHLVQPVWGPFEPTLKIEMWKITGSTSPPVRDSPPDYRLPAISRRTRFVEDDVEVFKIDGKLHYVGTGECVNTFSLEVLSKVLSANPRLTAEIVIFNRSRRKARIVTRLIRDEALSINKITADRLKIIYGGSGIAKEWSADGSAIELWLLPTKAK
jgi:hypothetical protein